MFPARRRCSYIITMHFTDDAIYASPPTPRAAAKVPPPKSGHDLIHYRMLCVLFIFRGLYKQAPSLHPPETHVHDYRTRAFPFNCCLVDTLMHRRFSECDTQFESSRKSRSSHTFYYDCETFRIPSLMSKSTIVYRRGDDKVHELSHYSSFSLPHHSAVYAVGVCLSVCVCVRHLPVLYKNG